MGIFELVTVFVCRFAVARCMLPNSLAKGPRMPAVMQAPKKFNTGMVLVVEHGKLTSPHLIERVNGIRERRIDYWSTTTGHRSTMTADPH